jgi:ubiquinone/menaquinone biosynthesis C-methylase UbiE/organic radical activating enzyme
LPISVGNILDFNSLTEIVQSPKAREIQASIIDGTYKYCDQNTCHVIKSDRLENRIEHRPDTVNWIVFAIDDSCNLSCPSCRNEMIFVNKGEEFEKRMTISRHITKLIQNHHHFLKFTLSGDGDPFASHVYRNILENLQLTDDDPIEIEIVTNGILVASHWDRMKGIHKHVKRFKISFDAGTPETYAITRRQGDWDKLIESSEYIVKWKQKYYSDMEIVANFVVQNTNYQDIHEYVRLTKRIGFDEIAFQKVTDWGKWWDGNKNRFVEHAVWMEDHPNYGDLVGILSDPIMGDKQIQLTNLAPLQQKEKLSLEELTRLKVNLQSVDRIDGMFQSLTKLKEYYWHLTSPFTYASDLSDLINQCHQIEDQITKLTAVNVSILEKISDNISDITKDYYNRGYSVYGNYKAIDRCNPQDERTRVMPITDDTTTEAILAQIGKYVNWQYPGLEIGPGAGVWTEHLVASEPLYLVDIHDEFLIETKTKFNDVYQNKLRSYITSETDLSMLPQNQFGFVFAWNVFNYLPFDLLDQYLESIYKVLRPGGVAMFSYNNAERPGCARYVDMGYMSYMPKHALMPLLEKYGYEVLSTQDLEEYISWVEIKKPGKLVTIKVHAPIGTVLGK